MHRLPSQCSICFRQFLFTRATFPGHPVRCKHLGAGSDLALSDDLASKNSTLTFEHDSSSAVNSRSTRRVQWFVDSVRDLRPGTALSINTNSTAAFNEDFGILSAEGGHGGLLTRQLMSESSQASYDWMNNPVPTIVDSSFMGGTSEDVVVVDPLLGNDVAALLEDYYENTGVYGSPTSLRTSEPSTSVCSEHFPRSAEGSVSERSRPNVSSIPGTRMIITDKIRQELKRRQEQLPQTQMMLSEKSETIQPTEPTIQSTDLQAPENDRFCRFSNRTEFATPQELLEALRYEDLSYVRRLMNSKLWPEAPGHWTVESLKLAIDQAFDCAEATLFFEEVSVANPRIWLPDFLPILLTHRIAKEEGVSRAVEFVERYRQLFPIRPASSRGTDKRMADALNQLFSISASGSIDNAILLFDTAREHGFRVDSRFFCNSVMHSAASRSYTEIYGDWTFISTRYICGDGVHVVLQSALEGKAELLAKRLSDILSTSTNVDDPLSCLAEMICVLVRIKRTSDAADIFSRVALSGRHFRRPLSRMAEDENGLQSVEHLASLVSRCMFGERRRGGKKKVAEVVASHEKPVTRLLSSDAIKVITSFCGIGGSKKTYKNMDRKKYKVDEEELHNLSEQILQVWSTLAEKSNDRESAQRLQLWSSSNRIDIPGMMQKKLDKLFISG